MTFHEYLLSYGTGGEFGRFHPVRSLTCRRGDRAVVRSHRGLELARVLCVATPGHARALPNNTVGQLLRLATADDDQAAQRSREKQHQVFQQARQLAVELSLPLEVLDVEVLLDGEHGILHHLSWAEFDERPLVSAVSKAHGLHLRLHTLRSEPAQEEEHGCGRPGCGKESGGCGSCSSGGCSTRGEDKKDDQAHFAALREKMHQQRVPLL